MGWHAGTVHTVQCRSTPAGQLQQLLHHAQKCGDGGAVRVLSRSVCKRIGVGSMVTLEDHCPAWQGHKCNSCAAGREGKQEGKQTDATQGAMAASLGETASYTVN
jgi:hypothetical protein